MNYYSYLRKGLLQCRKCPLISIQGFHGILTSLYKKALWFFQKCLSFILFSPEYLVHFSYQVKNSDFFNHEKEYSVFRSDNPDIVFVVICVYMQSHVLNGTIAQFWTLGMVKPNASTDP